MSSADLQVWVAVTESRTLGSFIFLFNLNYQTSYFVEKGKQSQAHRGSICLTAFSMNPCSSMCSNTFLPRANANLMCMEIIYSES